MLKSKKFAFPNDTVFLFLIIVFAMLLTWIVPGGSFDRVTDEATGNVLVKAGSYTEGESTPVSIAQMLTLIPKAMVDYGSICIYIIIIGGCMGVMRKTGAIDTMIGSFIKKHIKRSTFVIASLCALVSFLAAIMGFATEGQAILPILVSLCISVGFDALVGLAIILGGVATGYGAAIICPFNVGIAQTIIGLPMYSGVFFRSIIFVVMTFIFIFFVVRYARMVKANPEKSYVAHLDYSNFKLSIDDLPKITKKHKMVLFVYFGAIAFIIAGAIFGWFTSFDQYSAVFLGTTILVGIFGGLSMDELVEGFSEGCRPMGFVVILLGLGASIPAILAAGGIMDTLINILVKPMELFGSTSDYIGGVLMFFIQIALNVIMPSNSGQAMATMPILGPIGDLIGLNKQITVLAFHLGDGLTYNIFPTNAFILACANMANVSLKAWFKFVWPMVLVQVVVAVGFMLLSVAIDFGPF